MARTFPPLATALAALALALTMMHSASGSSAFGQSTSAPAKNAADPVAILKASLDAHRGSTKAFRPTRLLFHGTVIVDNEKGDTNTFNLDQWYERVDGKDTLATLLRPTGTATESKGGFDGKRHYMVVDGKRKVIDFAQDYKRDVARIKDDLARTRLIIDTFFAGAVLADPAALRYVRHSKSSKMESHVIDQLVDGKLKTRYYVNAKAGEPPYLLGVEYPKVPKTDKTEGVPKQNVCFSPNRIKRFGGIAISQDMQIYHDDRKRAAAIIWITKLSVDPKKRPDWKWLP